MKLQSITRKQTDILELIYQYRFLNRIQIQTLLKHKDYKRINVWLKDLTEQQYLERIYTNDFVGRTKPAIYYLGINGIRHLKTYNDWYELYPEVELRKRYRESDRSQTFIDKCLLIADCTIRLEQARNDVDWPYSHYFYETEADYMRESFYHFLTETEPAIHPDLCFCEMVYEGFGDETTKHSYLLEIFDATLPKYRPKKRLQDYITYLSEEAAEWQEQSLSDSLPIILLVYPRTTDLIYAKRRTRGILADSWDEDTERPHIRFTTIEKLKAYGVLGDIWEEA
jgi:hypothetical protein